MTVTHTCCYIYHVRAPCRKVIKAQWRRLRRNSGRMRRFDAEHSTIGTAAPTDRVRSSRIRLRATPGFIRQVLWCLARAVLQRTREPLSIFIDYMIFAITGALDLKLIILPRL